MAEFQKHSKAWAVDKVVKLMSMTTERGCSMHEAIAAANLAQKYMVEYNLSEIDIAIGKQVPDEMFDPVVEEIIHVHRNWIKYLANTVAKNMRCTLLVFSEKRKSYIRFIGHQSDKDIAVATFWMLFDACADGIEQERVRAYTEYGNVQGIEGSYAMGFIEAVQAEMGKQCQALMLIQPEDINDYLKEKYPHLRKANISVNRNGIHSSISQAHDNGYSRGKELTERRQLESFE